MYAISEPGILKKRIYKKYVYLASEGFLIQFNGRDKLYRANLFSGLLSSMETSWQKGAVEKVSEHLNF